MQITKINHTKIWYGDKSWYILYSKSFETEALFTKIEEKKK